MPNFSVRVEVLNSQGFEYQHLHDAMENIGLLRTVVDSENKELWLPFGIYYGTNYGTSGTVRDLVRDTVANIGRQTRIFVVQDGAAWASNNLKVATG